jgi:hypothetical protein
MLRQSNGRFGLLPFDVLAEEPFPWSTIYTISHPLDVDAKILVKHANRCAWFHSLPRTPDLCFWPIHAKLTSDPVLMPGHTDCPGIVLQGTVVWVECIWMFSGNWKLVWCLRGM